MHHHYPKTLRMLTSARRIRRMRAVVLRRRFTAPRHLWRVPLRFTT